MPTPISELQKIVDAIREQKNTGHWIAHRSSGSFTAPESDELLALVSAIGARDEVRWVVIGREDDDWQLRGTSQTLATGFDTYPSGYLPPDLLDFDADGRQEIVSHHFRLQDGWMTASDSLYRWNGHTLALIWEARTILDNRILDDAQASLPHRENYEAEWEWVDLDGDEVDEILLHERVSFYALNGTGSTSDDAPSIGKENGVRAFRWDGAAFRPYAPEGPLTSFAYVASNNLWLWQNNTAHPLDVEQVQEFTWSPSGQRLAWRSQPPLGSSETGATLGFYDLATDARKEFTVEAASSLEWVSEDRLAYARPGQFPALLNPTTGRQAPLAAFGSWSPDGSQMAYGQAGNLYIYDLSTGHSHSLIAASEQVTVANPTWSPRGDWIAYALQSADVVHAGLASPTSSELLSAPNLLKDYSGPIAPELQLAWSPDGASLAVWSADLISGQRPATLHVAQVPSLGSGSGKRPKWKEILQMQMITQTGKLAWSPNGEQIALAAGSEIWEVNVISPTQETGAGEPQPRHRFSVPAPRWIALEWSPDGSGFLAGLEIAGASYEERLYWFPADGAEPMLILADFNVVHFSSDIQ